MPFVNCTFQGSYYSLMFRDAFGMDWHYWFEMAAIVTIVDNKGSV